MTTEPDQKKKTPKHFILYLVILALSLNLMGRISQLTGPKINTQTRILTHNTENQTLYMQHKTEVMIPINT